MLDFVKVKYKINKDLSITVWPCFEAITKSEDLMVRGGAFYAIWDDRVGMWSKNEYDAIELVDNEVCLDNDKCIRCVECTNHCPVGALKRVEIE